MKVIIAPHPDDEIIGCFEVLKIADCIVYDGSTPQDRRQESMNLRDHMPNIKMQMFNHSIPPMVMQKENTFYMPIFSEHHPLHRKWGFAGDQMARNGFDIVFYTTQMDTLFIHEVENPQEKEELLNKVYPSQKSLWEYEKKYVLFEGYCKWIF